MKAKNIKSNSTKIAIEGIIENDSISQLVDNRPECPNCGNKHLNYLKVSTGKWVCSAEDCKKIFSLIENHKSKIG
jgi:ribosomal protein L37AE/L43A